MRLHTRALFAAGCVGLLALSNSAFSAPTSRGLGHQHRAPQQVKTGTIAQDAQRGVRNSRNAMIARRVAKHRAAMRVARANRSAYLFSTRVIEPPKPPAFGWPVLVREARKYIGTNPTARTKLWCATFMNLVLAKVGYAGTNSDAARSFATYGHRISEPRVGAIAVLTRGRYGGHVGVVTGVDPHGNPIIISGNHGHRVGEGVYPRSRVIAYVMPSERRPGEETRMAERSTPSAGNTVSLASRAPAEPTIDSPISELVAAIEAEQARSEAKAKVAQRPEPPPVPHRTVQQMPERAQQAPLRAQPMPERPQHIKHQPVERQARRAAPPVDRVQSRDLPLDPALAKLLGIKARAQAPQHRVRGNHVASAQH